MDVIVVVVVLKENNNNPFNSLLSRTTRVSRYQKNTHSHPVFVAIVQHL